VIGRVSGLQDLLGCDALPQLKEFEESTVVAEGCGQQACLLWGDDPRLNCVERAEARSRHYVTQLPRGVVQWPCLRRPPWC
jgi:hypothetical protein